jgi:hypothetical protein
MNWRPIETAPKDGQSILIGWQDQECGWQTRCAWWDVQFDLKWDEEKEGSYYRPAWTDARIMSFNYEETYSYEPTHWMPLPPPPPTEPAPQSVGEKLVLQAHSWSDTSLYSESTGQQICTHSIYGEATEETQDELETLQARNMERLRDCWNLLAGHDLSRVAVVKKEVLDGIGSVLADVAENGTGYLAIRAADAIVSLNAAD